nr:MAG TPA: hypothetical protein [Caudoviricetes sp.]
MNKKLQLNYLDIILLYNKGILLSYTISITL